MEARKRGTSSRAYVSIPPVAPGSRYARSNAIDGTPASYTGAVLATLRRVGAHPTLEPYVAAGLRARHVRGSARFFLGEALHRGAGDYEVRRTGQVLRIEHGTTDAATLDQAFIQDVFTPSTRIQSAIADLPRGFTALDLGANVGMWSAWVASLRPDARIRAVEPVARNVKSLRVNLANVCPVGSWDLVDAAAATTNGTVTFGGGDFTNGRVLDDDADGITVRAIDALPLIADADLVKIDIEGGEWPILLDSRFADAAPPVLMLEVHPMGVPSDNPVTYADSMLRAIGYDTTPPTAMDYPGTGIIWATRVR